ncbi:hypothetical protein BDQ17DRAFT_1334327 [Cyathus striatus]|nr:hypothetical protein BDQ17DRAFT_1334327 [Cyathus striatus]
MCNKHLNSTNLHHQTIGNSQQHTSSEDYQHKLENIMGIMEIVPRQTVVRAKDIQDGVVHEGPSGQLVMGSSGRYIPRVEGQPKQWEIECMLKESEGHSTGIDKGKAPAVMMQSTPLEGEPPLQLLQELQQYTGWLKAQNLTGPAQASTSQLLQSMTGKETTLEPDF